jgi:hypothetical protein
MAQDDYDMRLFPIHIDLIRFPTEKRNNKISNEINNEYKYLMWGYYDRARIILDSKDLSSLFLRDWENGKRQEEYESQFLNAYSEEDLEVFLGESFPLLVISEIKIDEDNLRRFTKKTISLDSSMTPMRIAKEVIVSELSKNKNEDWAFRVLYSLGFNDLLLIFTGRTYDSIIKSIDYLKNGSIKASQFIRSTYSLYGIDHSAIGNWSDEKIQKVSIFLSLKPGTTGTYIRNKIEDSLLAINGFEKKDDGKKQIEQQMDLESFSLFGKYDAEIVLKKKLLPLSSIASLYMGDYILSINNADFQKKINYTRTRWLYSDSGTRSASKKNTSISSNLNNNFLLEKFNKVESEITDLSLRNNFRALLDFFWQASNNEIINPILQKEFHQVLCDLLDTVYYSTHNPKRILDTESLESGIYLLAELLQDWVQSAKTIFEGPSFNIQFINSSSKVYILYYEIVNGIEKLLREKIIGPRNINQPLPNYFIMIDHGEKINSQLLFPRSFQYSGNNKQQRCSLILPIMINRELFFSPLKSLPYIFHEIGHYISHDVRKRNQALFQAVCMHVSREIFSEIIFQTESDYIKKRMLKGLDKETQERAIQCIYDLLEKRATKSLRLDIPVFVVFCDQLKKFMPELVSPINNELFELTSSLNNLCKKHPLKKEVEEEIDFVLSQMEKGICPNEIKQLIDDINEKLPDELALKFKQVSSAYDSQYMSLNEFSGKLSSIILGAGKNCSLKQLCDDEYSENEKTFLVNFIASQRFHENTEGNKEHIRKQALGIIRQIKFSEIIDIYEDLIVETTADLLMIKTLDFTYEEYTTFFTNAPLPVIPLDPETKNNRERRIKIVKDHWAEIIFHTSSTEISEKDDQLSGLAYKEIVKYLEEFSTILDKNYEQDGIVQHIREFYRNKNSEFLLLDYFFNNSIKGKNE